MLDGHSQANVPMDFIQEVQVKTSGFEAEYGGALGGVVNVIQKSGSNEVHGSVFSYYRANNFDATPCVRAPRRLRNPNPTLLLDPQSARSKSAPRRWTQALRILLPGARTTTASSIPASPWAAP